MSTEKKNRPANMTAEDQAALDAAGVAFNNAKTDDERVKAHADAEAIRAKYNYTGGADGSGKTYTTNTEEQARQQSYRDVADAASKVGNTGMVDAANRAMSQTAPQPGAPSLTAQVPDFTGLLDKWLESAKAQQEGAIDFATQQGITELERAEEDAQVEFDNQQKQVNLEEAKALDNQALYAEARGDKGGIGMAQYNQIQATAMQNRQAINTARTKLSTDTARQIEDLRAQGEFQKADSLLQTTQTYLAKLTELQQWGAEYALSVDQFNIQIQQWQAEYNMEVQKYHTSLEQWQAEFDYTVGQNAKEQLISTGETLLSMGIRPSADQMAAMGLTSSQVDAYIAQYQLEQAAKLSGGGKTPEAGAKEPNAKTNPYEFLNYHSVTDYNTAEALLSQFYDDDYAANLAEQYMDMVKNGKFDVPGEPEVITGTPSFSYDPDEGIFTYNGKQYNSLEKLQTAINNSVMSDAQFEALLKKLALYGIPVDAMEE